MPDITTHFRDPVTGKLATVITHDCAEIAEAIEVVKAEFGVTPVFAVGPPAATAAPAAATSGEAA